MRHGPFISRHALEQNQALNQIYMNNLLEQSQNASEFLKILANPNRLAVLCSLHEKKHNVTELTKITGMPQAAMSSQLAILRKAKLVSYDTKHRERLYYISDPKVIDAINLLYAMFCTDKP